MSKMSPRQTPTRDEYYMGRAFIIAAKSKDPSTQVGAFIVGKDNYPLGSGYNGPPRQMNDEEMDWSRPNKYPFIKHAEDNAIDHTTNRKDLVGATIYVTARPCGPCMLDIAAAGIARVVYYDYRSNDKNSLTCSQKELGDSEDIAFKNNIQLERFSGSLNWVKEHVAWMESIGLFNSLN